MQPLNCRTCWKTGPKITIYSTLFICTVSLITSIVDLAVYGRFGSVAAYLSLNPNSTIIKFELWRLLTTHFICPSLWNTLFVGMMVFFTGSQLELRLAPLRFVSIILGSLLAVSLIGICFAAFFGLVPGINYWSYFHDFWFDTAAVGPTTLIILLTFFEARINERKNVLCCCCCNLPIWLYLIILVVMCQLMLYPPWQGIWYTLSAVIVALVFPSKLFGQLREIQAPPAGNPMGGQQQQQQQQQQQKPHEFQTLNGDVPAQPPAGASKGDKKEAKIQQKAAKDQTKFTGTARKL
ncbi:Transmembrane domain-containing protein [Spironucleus salmonicida]|uniref:Transmembrane domain-containing protein n=1 Tax=Spironucleus salmonicida TaxID=348837 RepID=V6LYB2_9EUKA|nr:Transmembrane domain-containing protein [Spironucleus salmonicida]|eukprot:EST45789.1 Transmembrane domain-containing protein [Spironucleus salmonicida]